MKSEFEMMFLDGFITRQWSSRNTEYTRAWLRGLHVLASGSLEDEIDFLIDVLFERAYLDVKKAA